MAEKIESSQNGQKKSELSSLFDEIKWSVDNFLEKSWIANILRSLWLKKDKETQEELSKSEKELNELSKKLIDIEFDKFKDKEIDLEWDLDKLDDETTILWLLARNNKNIKLWFEWLKDIDDEDVRSWEIEIVLYSLKEISDNDNDKKWDLTEQELKEIWENTEKKMKLCDKVLKTLENDNNIPEDKKTKKVILEAYSNLLEEKKLNILDVTEENENLIIEKIKTSSEL